MLRIMNDERRTKNEEGLQVLLCVASHRSSFGIHHSATRGSYRG